MIEIKTASKEEWINFLATEGPRTFLHSWNWGDFNESLGYKVFHLGIYDGDILAAIALIVKVAARRGSFLLIPHGPIIVKSLNLKVENYILELKNHLKKLAQEENCSFIRISPFMPKTEENARIFEDLGFRKAPMHVHPELCWILDIDKPEDELLKEMRKTTRYSINKAGKDGVQIETSDKVEDVEKFNEIYQSTVERQNFTPFPLKYLKNEFQTFAKDDESLIFFAKYNGEVVSSAIIIFSNGGAYYHQGATNLKYPKIPAAYLLQWAVIKEAKRRDCSFYNFWGIAPENSKNHPFAGLSLFKRGFGGKAQEYLTAQDLIISKKYWLNWLIETFRKIKRGF